MSTTQKRKATQILSASDELYTALEELVELFEDSHATELRKHREGCDNDPVLRLYEESIRNARKALVNAKEEN